ncbi:permease [Kiloniella sp. b19]|uniref:permease n=1 Tax=Kiloniella sp. GXU_MW_B19 TaxID=3141326 RepID=UPI0031CEC0A1
MPEQLQDTLGMFAFLAVELSVLFLGISYLVGILQRHIPASTIERLLSSGRRRGYFFAAALGSITPFCSCSTIPMLKGLIKAGAGFGPMMVFLFTSPLLNPVVVVLLTASFGFRLTAIYVLAALLVSLGSGWLLHRLKFNRFIRSSEEPATATACGTADNSCGLPTENTCSGGSSSQNDCGGSSPAPQSKSEQYLALWREVWKDYVGVLPYLLLGISIGSAIYGYMPTGLLERFAGADNPLAIPVAAIIGVPLYIRATAVIPLADALMLKGVSAGTILALIIGSAGASLTEVILLRSLFTTKLLIAFVTVIFSMAIIAGYTAFVFY